MYKSPVDVLNIRHEIDYRYRYRYRFGDKYTDNNIIVTLELN